MGRQTAATPFDELVAKEPETHERMKNAVSHAAFGESLAIIDRRSPRPKRNPF